MPRTALPFRPFSLILGLVASVILSPTVARGGWFPDDQGFYRVYQADRLLGTESVTFEQRNDSTVVVSLISELLPRTGGKSDTLRKNSILAISAREGSVRGYQSHQLVNG